MADSQSAFLRAICEDPGDNLRRLVYADWLEENATTVDCPSRNGKGGYGGFDGEDECVQCLDCDGSGEVPDGNKARAEFIRVSCRIAAFGDARDETLKMDLDRNHRIPVRGEGKEYNRSQMGEMLKALSPECRRLLLENWKAWTPQLSTTSTFEVVLSDRWTFSGTPAVSYSRGFVSAVTLPTATFLDRARELFAGNPIERVVLSDRRPQRTGGVAIWYSQLHGGTAGISQQHLAPDELFGLLPGQPQRIRGHRLAAFSSVDSAVSALSAACVAYGRRLAGLPELAARTTA